MSAFNKKRTNHEKLVSHPDATTNHEGAIAFLMTPKMELYTRVATCLYGQDKFYVSGKKADNDLQSVLSQVIREDPKFVLDLAAYTRNKLYLRTVPLVLLAEVANQASGQVEGGYQYVPHIVKRADEITEILAYQLQRNKFNIRAGKKIPKMLQKGLRIAMQNFSGYQYAKYNRKGEVTFKDAMTLVRPKPKDENQQLIFEKLVNGIALPIPNTWEMNTTICGSNKETWEKNVEVMPYMATLRNLRNLLEHDVNNLDVALNRLTDPKEVINSKQLPFRFYSAYQEVSAIQSTKTVKVLDALNIALDISIENIPKVNGRTAVLVDLSGSMQSPVSGNSKVNCNDISALFGAITSKAYDDTIVYAFACESKIVHISKKDSILTNTKKIKAMQVGGSTNAYLPVKHLSRTNTHVDRIILFSDMQCYDSKNSGWGRSDIAPAFLHYRNKVNPNCRMYSVDLHGYGTSKWPKDTQGVYTLSGWNSSIFSFINAIEKSDEEVLKQISNYIEFL